MESSGSRFRKPENVINRYGALKRYNKAKARLQCC